MANSSLKRKEGPAVKDLVVIVTYNSSDFIESCLRSLVPLLKDRYDCIILDNASRDGTAGKVEKLLEELDSRDTRLIRSPKNLGFAGGIDRIVFGLDKPDIYGNLILLNPDVLLQEDTLDELTRPLSERDIFVAGGLILEMDRNGNRDDATIQQAGGVIGDNYITRHLYSKKSYGTFKKEAKKEKPYYETDYASGALLATKMDIFIDLGGFDTGYRPAYFEELDYCLLIRSLGGKTVINPASKAWHYQGSSVESYSKRFYEYYHKNRIRCAIINLGIRGFFNTFLPEERDWLKVSATSDQRWPLFYAYFLNLLFLPYNLAVKIRRKSLIKKIGRKTVSK